MKTMRLPVGTITFLFTDIEGSTKLWELFPAEMPGVLARHDLLLRDAINRNNGYVFKTIGDSFCAAFPTAPEAALAAFAAQQALNDEPWGLPAPFWVRMALHTGTAEVRDDDYFGQPLNRVARLMSVGYGGQILLSQATQELTRDVLPAGTSLRELGSHRLKDLARPESIYQLCHPSLSAEFPPLRTLDNPALPNNLPEQVTSFIGREKEAGEVKALLEKSRLLTLVGSGGCGKTRLSLQVAAEALEEYPDGVWFVDLAALSDPSLVPQAAARIVGVREEVGRTLIQTVTNHLKPRRILLILDNCEHLLDACAQLATTLLRNCPQVTMLASSREGMGIAGEQTYRIPSLSLPEAGEESAQTPESLARYESVRLFVDRAASVQSTFAVTNASAPTVAKICMRLDGIPLAIELAAVRVRSLSAEEINDRLDNRFRLLTGGSRTALPRQQTLRSLIDWSYDLLNAAEKRFFARLSVFAGGWTLAAAEQVCCDAPDEPEPLIEEWGVLDLLTSLADKSLVFAEPQGEGNTRYRLLETVRQYARDRLAEGKEQDAVRGRHQEYFLALAEEAEPKLHAAEQAVWLRRLEKEHDNLRLALEWSDPGGAGDVAGAKIRVLRLAVALGRFWLSRGFYKEGRDRLRDALADVVALPPEHSLTDATKATRAKAQRAEGMIAEAQGDYAAARALYENSLTSCREAGDRFGIALALNSLGGVAAQFQSDYREARALQEESLSIFRELGYKQQAASCLNNLGMYAVIRGDYAAAQQLHEESLSVARELGDQQCIALTLLSIGSIMRNQGDLASAGALYEESLVIAREVGNKHLTARSLLNRGSVAILQRDLATAHALLQESLATARKAGSKQGIADATSYLGILANLTGDRERALAIQKECLALYEELGDKEGTCYTLEAFAVLATVGGQADRAARLFGAAERLRENIAAPLPPSEREEYERNVSEARAALGDEKFAASWAEGCTLTIEQATEYAATPSL